jgi:hypothetical protein
MGRSRSAWSFLANLPSITTKGEQFVETREALQAVARSEKLDQQTIERLHGEGYIEVCDATHMQSPEREFLPTYLTEKARRLSNAASHKP